MATNTNRIDSVPSNKVSFSLLLIFSALVSLEHIWVQKLHPTTKMSKESVLKEMIVGEIGVEDKTTISVTKTEKIIQDSARGFQRSMGWKTQLLMWSLYLGGNLIPIGVLLFDLSRAFHVKWKSYTYSTNSNTLRITSPSHVSSTPRLGHAGR